MIDKLNSVNAGNTQNKRVLEENRGKDTTIKASKVDPDVSKESNDDIQISSELNVKEMSTQPPIDKAKVSAIKTAIARGDYPVDLDKVADALLQAYSDIK